MDFFEYASLVSAFVVEEQRWISYVVGGLCFLIIFGFQAVALYTIAGREGYKNRWFAFIPFLNTYYIGVCAQKNRCFKTVDTKLIAMITAIVEALLVIGFILNEVGCSLAMPFAEVIETNEIYGVTIEIKEVRSIPENLAWAGWCYNYLYEYILRWVELVYLFLEIMVLVAFFQTYASRRYLLFTITSVLFPIQGILFFVVRNNAGMNYRDFLRAEQERQYKMYSQYRQQYNQNPYERNYGQPPYDQNPYGQNPYSNKNENAGAASADDPFSEYGNDKNPDDPFGDLN
ncbi:MAG: hypothetical protein K2I20_03040 [Clostridia bacterium]|nr:hypothetical protein [Clostridia bacterium]MDE6356502.1 hypothetical protein [Clostridia bacterium]